MPTGDNLVCLLAEGSYFHGAAALCNSLCRNGFQGEVLLGYRGVLPDWARRLPPAGDGAQAVAPGVTIRFIEIEPGWHLTNVKARFMQHIVDGYPRFETLFYFDVDLVITTHWENFVRWTRHGVVLALDIAETYMPPDHVFRREWQELAARIGYGSRPVTGYFNGGCVGIARTDIAFLDIWANLLDALSAEGADMTQIVAPAGKPEFARMDQDILNAAVMASDVPIALLGSEAMGNFPPGSLMAHAMIMRKPWLRNYLLDALKGLPPDRTHLAFWNYVDGPIMPFSAGTLRWKRLQVQAASIIGKLHRRPVRDW